MMIAAPGRQLNLVRKGHHPLGRLRDTEIFKGGLVFRVMRLPHAPDVQGVHRRGCYDEAAVSGPSASEYVARRRPLSHLPPGGFPYDHRRRFVHVGRVYQRHCEVPSIWREIQISNDIRLTFGMANEAAVRRVQKGNYLVAAGRRQVFAIR